MLYLHMLYIYNFWNSFLIQRVRTYFGITIQNMFVDKSIASVLLMIQAYLKF